jgi:hypothetical protein
MALLAAIVLLALSTALVVGTFSLAHALRRAALSSVLRARVDEGVARAFGEVLQGWSPALDSLVPGGSATVALPPEPLAAGPPLQRRARVEHVTNGLYAITVDLCAYDCAAPLAQRRARLWLQRGAAAGQPIPPQLVTPWAFVDLY